MAANPIIPGCMAFPGAPEGFPPPPGAIQGAPTDEQVGKRAKYAHGLLDAGEVATDLNANAWSNGPRHGTQMCGRIPSKGPQSLNGPHRLLIQVRRCGRWVPI